MESAKADNKPEVVNTTVNYQSGLCNDVLLKMEPAESIVEGESALDINLTIDSNATIPQQEDKYTDMDRDEISIPDITDSNLLEDHVQVVPISEGRNEEKACAEEENMEVETEEELVGLLESMGFTRDYLKLKPPPKFDLLIPYQDFTDGFNYESMKFMGGKWAGVISKYLTEAQGFCSFNARRPPYYYPEGHDLFCTLHGYCGGTCHLTFKVIVTEPPKLGEVVRCTVSSVGLFTLLQHVPTGREVRGMERGNLAKKLANHKATKIFIESCASLNATRLLHCNYQQKSLAVLNKIRSEATQSITKDPDPKLDLEIFRQELMNADNSSKHVKGYIQECITTPNQLKVLMYDEKSLRLLLNCNRFSPVALHVDATGSVVKKVNDKRTFLYLAYASPTKGGSFPLAECISQRHGGVDISEIFLRIREDIKHISPSYKGAIANVVVCDFSQAMLSGLCLGINRMEVFDYLDYSFDILRDRKCIADERSVIFICTAHLINAYNRLLCKHIPRTAENRPVRVLAVNTLARLQEAPTLHEYVKTCYISLMAFCQEKLQPSEITCYRDYLMGNKDIASAHDASPEPTTMSEDLPGFKNAHSRHQSPYFKLFFEIRENVDTRLPKPDDIINPYFKPKAMDLLQEYYIPYSGFFSSMILHKTGRFDVNRLTNGKIEAEFNVIKNLFHDQGLAKYSVFVRNNHQYHTGRCTQSFGTSIRTIVKQANSKTEKPHSLKRLKKSRIDLAEENWGKSKAKQRTRYVRTPVSIKLNTRLSCKDSHVPNQDQVLNEVISAVIQSVSNAVVQHSVGNIVGSETCTKFQPEDNSLKAIDENSSENSFEDFLAIVDSEIADIGNWKSTAGQTTVETRVQEVIENDINNIDVNMEEYEEQAILRILSYQNIMTIVNNEMLHQECLDAYVSAIEEDLESTEYVVSRPTFCYRERNAKGVYEWMHSRGDGEDPIDLLTNKNVSRKRYTLHPFLISKHFVLLHIDHTLRKCTVIDSAPPWHAANRTTKLENIRQYGLQPFLRKSDNVINWTVEFAQNAARQHDAVSCGVFVMSQIRNIISGFGDAPGPIKYSGHLDLKSYKFLILGEMLNHSKEGREIIEQANSSYDKLCEILHDRKGFNVRVERFEPL